MADRWTPDEDVLLKNIYPNNSKETILSRLNKGWKTICRRARRLDLHRDVLLVNEDKKIRGPRKDTYTEPELELIRQIYAHNRKDFILATFSEAGYDRSWQSIRLNAKNMGIHRDPEIVKQEMIELGTIGSTQNRDDLWTEEEDTYLKENYRFSLREDILNNLPNRKWKAIREHCTSLGLTRDRSVINQDMATRLKENYGVTSTWQLEKVQEASRQTNLSKRGVEYPSQDPEVRNKIKTVVREKYGVDNVFQAEEIKEQIAKTKSENNSNA